MHQLKGETGAGCEVLDEAVVLRHDAAVNIEELGGGGTV
jgi:hypothetical protein